MRPRSPRPIYLIPQTETNQTALCKIRDKLIPIFPFQIIWFPNKFNWFRKVSSYQYSCQFNHVVSFKIYSILLLQTLAPFTFIEFLMYHPKTFSTPLSYQCHVTTRQQSIPPYQLHLSFTWSIKKATVSILNQAMTYFCILAQKRSFHSKISRMFLIFFFEVGY